MEAKPLSSGQWTVRAFSAKILYTCISSAVDACSRPQPDLIAFVLHKFTSGSTLSIGLAQLRPHLV
jgi:hypothetical protein